jgi:steroid delta-isomerase-like uncharacterized protein
MMTEADIKTKIRALFDRVLNQNDLGQLDDLIADDYLDHDPVPGQLPGAEGIKNKLKGLREAYPDIRFILEDLVAEGDIVAARYHWEATHAGQFVGIPATGKKVSVKGMDFYRFSGGRIIEHWDTVDELGLLRQLGAIPG